MKIDFWNVIPQHVKEQLNTIVGAKQETKNGKEDEFTIRLMLNEIGFYRLETAIKHYTDLGHKREEALSHIVACIEIEEAEMLSIGTTDYVRMFSEY